MRVAPRTHCERESERVILYSVSNLLQAQEKVQAQAKGRIGLFHVDP